SGSVTRRGSSQSCRRFCRAPSCTWGGGTVHAAPPRRGQTGTCCRTCSCPSPGSRGTAPSCNDWGPPLAEPGPPGSMREGSRAGEPRWRRKERPPGSAVRRRTAGCCWTRSGSWSGRVCRGAV
uniref:Uncharacterized protein n=1 Tax=Gasterosteus aculeatus TaxID=69293 RepID=G3P0B5_GASAC